ncbi:ornithine acetyltransferase [Petrotoga sp. HWH.PT.55.6.1]|jgi:glutamate N-acetyltransferase/amino-acid N-acetyltransferase|nr:MULTISPECIES: bifunctional glutamate N-acetyltransferase/amino-acid acetyltransferase ArgJ [unclassified Petrotoga]MBL5981591.1 ornithine acetyltransferase [Petrotoga sp. 8T1HF07.NaAc.6.1]PNR92180.1 ornithine acetyltransferase [Petrotoga sp. HWHPT.55.6.3]RPD35842.1 ornithine acetyltransferase [Petrotoga sp. HWH.PT.55.6.1]
MESTEIMQEGIVLPLGFKVWGIHCGIKKLKKDLGLIYSEKKANASAVFTTNKVKAAPVILSMENIKDNEIQAVIVNSGNANACTGVKGYSDAISMAEKTAQILNLKSEDVFVSSTGVIGVPLPIEKILNGIESFEKNIDLTNDDLLSFAQAIMTTDTFPKINSTQVVIGGKKITLTGVAKGSGMIHPNMATMLSFIMTDANISKSALNKALKHSVDNSFNLITVDGDTSTNDTVLILANKQAKNEEITEDSSEYNLFQKALYEVVENLAKKIVMDGEGATKFFEVQVKNAKTKEDAKLISRSIAKSNLVKTAIHGEDANWGRVLAAAGYSGGNFDPDKVDVWFQSCVGKIQLCQDGHFIDFNEVKAKEILGKKELKIIVDLKDGEESAISWGCDLSYKYVEINGGYRT